MRQTVTKVIYATMLVCMMYFSMKTSSAQTVSGDYTYELNQQNQATIILYSGSETNVDIPASLDGYPVVKIGGQAFQGNTTMELVMIPEGVIEIGKRYIDNPYEPGPFAKCTNLATVSLPNTLEVIGQRTFENCTSLVDISLPSSVYHLGLHAFGGCTSLPSIHLPKNLSDAYNAPFAGTINMKEVTFEEGTNTLFTGMFQGTHFETIVIPEGVTTIPSGTFGYNRVLSNVIMPSTLTTIEDYAFHDTDSLKHLVIPSNVTNISDNMLNKFTSEVNANGEYVQVPVKIDYTQITIEGEYGSEAQNYAERVGANFVVSSEFTDVTPGGWEYEPILYAYNHNLMAGTGMDANGNVVFNPNGVLTREQFAQILYNAEGKPAITFTNRFSDVPDGQWYSSAIIWAAENNIVSGYNNGKYGVGDVITREQLAVMLYKYAQLKGKSTDGVPTTALDGFGDKAQVSDWASTQIQWAVHNKVMSGTGVNLEPKGQATRAACAAMLRNYFEGVGK